MTKASSVILVHGAWADGSSWSKVIPLLLDGGLRVAAVQLPLTSLKDDAATVKRAIALEDGPIILVGHSYGGVVITEAGDDPKVAGLVYIAAFAPDVMLWTAPPRHESAMDVGAVRTPHDSEEPDHANGYDYRSRYREVGFSSSWRRRGW
jgi:pimeloyl-ACP methyl ester carboxylesterase